VFIAVIRDPDAVRRPAVRLPVSPSRLRLDGLTGSRTALWASSTNGLAAGRRTASGSRITEINTIVMS